LVREGRREEAGKGKEEGEEKGGLSHVLLGSPAGCAPRMRKRKPYQKREKEKED